jgi:hypothetical protein
MSIFLYNVASLLCGGAALSYTGLILFAVISKLGNRRLPIAKWIKYCLIAGPFVIVGLGLLMITLNDSASAERYTQWTEKCGHEPVVGVQGLVDGVEDTAYIGLFGKSHSTVATEYFCTFVEANAQDFQPDSYIKKKDLIDAKYTPSTEDLNLINRGRDPKDRIKY